MIPTLPKYTVGSVPGHCVHVRVTFVVVFCCCFVLFVLGFLVGFFLFRVVVFSFANDRHNF